MVQPFQKCLIASINMKLKLDVNSELLQTLSGLLCDCFCRLLCVTEVQMIKLRRNTVQNVL